ncbi:MAG: TIGR03960 family B12-binding radical SAM protein [Caldicoprobacterales bacterium]|nr:TIGR03960 family B12-binding radical SAM protein [Clostridia bacterium]MDI9512228.1 TIGR03960 family B12-binding radical SAM protein [Bacillota bacterium]
MSKDLIDKILGQVSKPVRYMGNEYNMVEKDLQDIKIRFAFAFPDVYEVGMSHLGMKILYHLLNEREDTYCERVFAPWTDMEDKMRDHGIDLFSLETKDPIRDFDFVGFTLQYEMSYSNIINMLDLSRIPILAEDRTTDDPFVLVGGPCAYNSEPLADFIDLVVLGEAEEVMDDLLDIYKLWKRGTGSRDDFLLSAAQIEGVYVPKFYDISYADDGRLLSINPNKPKLPKTIKKRIVKDLDSAYFPDKIIVPFMKLVHDRVVLEIFRGCSRGCRFCQAGMIYRPVRERSTEKLLDMADKLLKSTGYEEMSLASLSTSDYSGLEDLVIGLMERYLPQRISLSLPSLRLDSFDKAFIEQIQKVRKTGLTFAPEAGTQRLRDVINKGIRQEDLTSTVKDAFESGWNSVKLYFMIGLPTETMDDIYGIADLAETVVDTYYSVDKDKRQRGLRVGVSASSFVPKAFTPFQWARQDSMEDLREKQAALGKRIRNKHIDFSWHDPETSFMEAVFAKGDRRLGKVLYTAWQLGARFDGWAEHFKLDIWEAAFEKCGLDPAFYAYREREENELFPWDHIDVGVSKSFLWKEYQKALKGETTGDCRETCSNCGIRRLGEGLC